MKSITGEYADWIYRLSWVQEFVTHLTYDELVKLSDMRLHAFLLSDCACQD